MYLNASTLESKGTRVTGVFPIVTAGVSPRCLFVGQVAPVTLYLHTVVVMHIRSKRACVDVYLYQREGFYSLHALTRQMYRFTATCRDISGLVCKILTLCSV